MTPLSRQAGAPYIPQTPSMHPSDQAQLYCRAPNLYPKITVPLSPGKIIEWLKKAADYAPQLSLYWDYIDKPTDGQIVMVWSPPSLEHLPPDGYHWIDAEKSYRLPSSEGRELICYELKQGFLHGERVTSMSRRRYRLKGHGANECLMLMHYRRSEDADCVLVDESQVRYPPRRYPLVPIPAPVGSNLASRSQADIMNVPSSEGSMHSSVRSLPNPATSVPRVQQRAPHTPSKKKTITGLKPKSATSLQLENDGGPEPYGDDLDHLTARDVALARYKRNHEHIAELFAPVQSSSLKRPRLDLLDRKQKLLEMTEKDKSEAEKLRLNHAERMSVFKSSSSEFWRQYAELERCGSLEELEQAQSAMEQQLNLTIREYQKVRVVNMESLSVASVVGGGGGMRIEDVSNLKGDETMM